MCTFTLSACHACAHRSTPRQTHAKCQCCDSSPIVAFSQQNRRFTIFFFIDFFFFKLSSQEGLLFTAFVSPPQRGMSLDSMPETSRRSPKRATALEEARRPESKRIEPKRNGQLHHYFSPKESPLQQPGKAAMSDRKKDAVAGGTAAQDDGQRAENVSERGGG
ncbi:hypothetical protein CAOG_009540 [Capsaspora owczarzaki ATCC 30864]|uniref:Uncharacterized protein n=1 Tax=Capsaspora owczarzaki (strain ATCC 30864) TaxID=595528 RepID=A0A0D2WL63_CAPO3|nr:hypothetical protein CAOG_009540 [Capsaspora owczarzaki ATCC 30864]